MKKLLVLSGLAALSMPVYAINLYSNQSLNADIAALNFQNTTRSGVAAPAGAAWSELQADGAGVQASSNTSAGFSVGLSGTGPSFRLADDFTVAPGGWLVSGISVYSYQTGASANPVNNGSLKIWSGRPGETSSIELFNSTTISVTDQLQLDTNTVGVAYRLFSTNSPAPGSAPGTTRKIWQTTFSFANINLAAGTYWIDYQISPTTGGMFAPSTTHQDMRGVSGANARQLTGATWVDAIDTGNPASAADVAQDMPFIIAGEPVPEPGTMAALGLGLAAFLKRRRAK